MSLPVADFKPYVVLIAAFVEGRLSADEFEAVYLFTFKNDRNYQKESVYEVLNTLFSAVDDYCADETIRTERDLDFEQLRDKATIALRLLQELSMDDRI